MPQSKSLADLVQEYLGVHTFENVNPQISSVGATSTIVFKPNPNRVWLAVINLSVVDMYFGPFRNVSSTRGIWVAPSGGLVTLDYREDLELLSMEWSIIATAASSSLLSIEQLTQRDPSK